MPTLRQRGRSRDRLDVRRAPNGTGRRRDGTMPRVGKGRKSKAATEQRGPVAAAPTGTKQEPDPFRVLCRHWPSADGRKTTTEQMGNRGFRRFRKASSPRNLAGKPLAEFFTTPIRRITVFYGMIMCFNTFHIPLLHRFRKRWLEENRGPGQISRAAFLPLVTLPITSFSGQSDAPAA